MPAAAGASSPPRWRRRSSTTGSRVTPVPRPTRRCRRSGRRRDAIDRAVRARCVRPAPRAAEVRSVRFDRRLLTHFEWMLPLMAVGVCVLGILTVYSASYTPGSDGPPPMAVRQLIWFVAGTAILLQPDLGSAALVVRSEEHTSE